MREGVACVLTQRQALQYLCVWELVQAAAGQLDLHESTLRVGTLVMRRPVTRLMRQSLG
jgi:hypothetical protein